MDYAFKSFAVFVMPFVTETNDKTTGVKYWHFCPETQSFQRAFLLQGRRTLAIMLEQRHWGCGGVGVGGGVDL